MTSHELAAILLEQPNVSVTIEAKEITKVILCKEVKQSHNVFGERISVTVPAYITIR